MCQHVDAGRCSDAGVDGGTGGPTHGAGCGCTTAEAALLQRLVTPRKAKTLKRHWPLLESLRARGVVRWTFPVAISHGPLKSVPSLPRGEALGAGTPAFEARFTALTAHAPRRHEGRTYGARSLAYEECRRAVDFELSEAMRARVSRPLSVVLDVARWYSAQLAAQLERRLLAKFTRRTPLHVFWAQTASLFAGEAPPLVTPTARALRKKWNALWAGRADVPLEEAERFVATRFRADAPGWPGARHHAPDLLWAAPSAEAMLRGEGTPILGELHPVVTPFTTLSVLAHAPDKAALERQWKEDFGVDGVTPIPWEDFARSSHDARLSTRRWHLDVGYEFESDLPARRVLRAADFDVVKRRGRLVAVHLTRALAFDLTQLFERRVKLLAALHFSLADGLDAGPRRTLGGLVVQRAHWKLVRAATAQLDDPAARARFRAAHGLPRRVFVRSPQEVKPVYVDFDAPVLVEQLGGSRARSTGSRSLRCFRGLTGCGSVTPRARASCASCAASPSTRAPGDPRGRALHTVCRWLHTAAGAPPVAARGWRRRAACEARGS